MFIARISRGRTVREFVTAVLFIPAGFTFIWMTVFGNTAMFIDTGIAAGEVGRAVAADVATGLFQFFQYLPFTGITSTLAILLVAIFFITSSDSGSLVVDSIAAGGETETTTGQRVIYTGPAHPYGSGLWPIPALGIGYSETKIVECYDLCTAIVTGRQPSPNFEDGYRIALIADAILASGESGQWVDIP